MHTLISYTQPSGVEATQCNAEFLLPLLCVLREGVLLSTQEQAGLSGTACQGHYYSSKDLQSKQYIF